MLYQFKPIQSWQAAGELHARCSKVQGGRPHSTCMRTARRACRGSKARARAFSRPHLVELARQPQRRGAELLQRRARQRAAREEAVDVVDSQEERRLGGRVWVWNKGWCEHAVQRGPEGSTAAARGSTHARMPPAPAAAAAACALPGCACRPPYAPGSAGTQTRPRSSSRRGRGAGAR